VHSSLAVLHLFLPHRKRYRVNGVLRNSKRSSLPSGQGPLSRPNLRSSAAKVLASNSSTAPKVYAKNPTSRNDSWTVKEGENENEADEEEEEEEEEEEKGEVRSAARRQSMESVARNNKKKGTSKGTTSEDSVFERLHEHAFAISAERHRQRAMKAAHETDGCTFSPLLATATATNANNISEAPALDRDAAVQQSVSSPSVSSLNAPQVEKSRKDTKDKPFMTRAEAAAAKHVARQTAKAQAEAQRQAEKVAKDRWQPLAPVTSLHAASSSVPEMRPRTTVKERHNLG